MVSRARLVALGATAAALIACALGPWSAAQAQQAPDYLSWADPGLYLTSNGADFSLDSFGASQPLVTTYFFYWFDTAFLSQQARGFSVYAYQPTDESTMSFFDPGWYHKQFTDMLAAGVDFVLPDYWGEPGQYDKRVAPAPELN